MKTVFASNSQVAHVWAQQTQSSGKSSNLFFEDTCIYSYGRHYLAAKIHTIKGKKIALINSDTYSPSTGKHLSEIRSALRDLMPKFNVPNPSDIKDEKNYEYMVSNIKYAIEQSLKRSKITDLESVRYNLNTIDDVIKEANEYFKLIGKRAYKMPVKTRKQILDHLNARLKRYQELNTPEMIAAKKAKQDKITAEKYAESIADFRAGKNTNIHGLPYDLLRIQGNEVITSRGARVPLIVAKHLLESLLKGRDITGETVGQFAITSVNNDTVKIGCHEIAISEAKQVLLGEVNDYIY